MIHFFTLTFKKQFQPREIRFHPMEGRELLAQWAQRAVSATDLSSLTPLHPSTASKLNQKIIISHKDAKLPSPVILEESTTAPRDL